MKKTISFLLLLLCAFAATARAEWQAVRSYLEAYGECNLLNLKDSYMIDSETNDERLVGTVAVNFNAVFMGDLEPGLFAVYLKKDNVALETKNNIETYSAARKIKMSISEQLGVHYVGLGYRRYFAGEERATPGAVMLSAGIDAGMFFTVNAVSEVTFTDQAGTEIAKEAMRVQGVFPGGNAETGIDYWFAGDAGLFLRGGYRLCSGKAGIERYGDAEANGIRININDTINHSGFYIQLGSMIKFQEF